MTSGPGKAYRWGVLGIIMMGTFMAILDTSIVNVALPHMMSAFGVNRDQIEWVSTGFMLASAAIMPLLDLRLFLIRNYLMSILLAIFRAIGLFGSVFLLPIFLQGLMGYTTVQAGLWMMPGALAVGATMPLAGRLADRYSPRMLTTVGAIMTGLSLVMYGYLDPRSGWQILVIPQLIRGSGLALMMAPLLAAALNSVPRHEVPMASSFLNVSQNVGGSLGIALLNTFVTNSIHIHAVRMGEVFALQSQPLYRYAYATSDLVFRQAHGIAMTPQIKTEFAAVSTILQRAQVMGFDNGFVVAGLIILAGIPLCLLLKPSAHHLGSEPEKSAKVELVVE